MEADAVVTDNAVGAASAAAHLMAAATPDSPIWATARTSRPPGNAGGGSWRRSAGHGIPTSTIPVREDLHDEESARLAALELLTAEDPPTAIFSSQNLVTFGVMRALRELGCKQPRGADRVR